MSCERSRTIFHRHQPRAAALSFLVQILASCGRRISHKIVNVVSEEDIAVIWGAGWCVFLQGCFFSSPVNFSTTNAPPPPTINLLGVTVAERLACLHLLPRRSGFNHRPDFVCGDRAGRCGWSARFYSRRCPVSPALSFRHRSILTSITLSALKTAMFRAVRISLPPPPPHQPLPNGQSQITLHAPSVLPGGRDITFVRRMGETSMEQLRNAWEGETGDPRENPLISSIVRHDSRVRQSGSDPAGNRTKSRSREVQAKQLKGGFFRRSERHQRAGYLPITLPRAVLAGLFLPRLREARVSRTRRMKFANEGQELLENKEERLEMVPLPEEAADWYVECRVIAGTRAAPVLARLNGLGKALLRECSGRRGVWRTFWARLTELYSPHRRPSCGSCRQVRDTIGATREDGDQRVYNTFARMYPTNLNLHLPGVRSPKARMMRRPRTPSSETCALVHVCSTRLRSFVLTNSNASQSLPLLSRDAVWSSGTFNSITELNARPGLRRESTNLKPSSRTRHHCTTPAKKTESGGGRSADKSAGFIGSLPFPPNSFIPAPIHTYLNHPYGFRDLAVKSRPNIFTLHSLTVIRPGRDKEGSCTRRARGRQKRLNYTRPKLGRIAISKIFRFDVSEPLTELLIAGRRFRNKLDSLADSVFSRVAAPPLLAAYTNPNDCEVVISVALFLIAARPGVIRTRELNAVRAGPSQRKYLRCSTPIVCPNTASQKQSSDTHKTPYDRVKRCQEHTISCPVSHRKHVLSGLRNNVTRVGKLLHSCRERHVTRETPRGYPEWRPGTQSILRERFSGAARVCGQYFKSRDNGDVWAAVNIGVSLANEREASAGMRRGEGNGRSPRKPTGPAASSSTIPKCENPGGTPTGTETGSPWWEASVLPAEPPRPRPQFKNFCLIFKLRNGARVNGRPFARLSGQELDSLNTPSKYVELPRISTLILLREILQEHPTFNPLEPHRQQSSGVEVAESRKWIQTRRCFPVRSITPSPPPRTGLPWPVSAPCLLVSTSEQRCYGERGPDKTCPRRRT
ncbi:hypothetical protein PR048_027537 [Dryococelus australis]|uniref:Uncharacterized protein n=1 Tax=Dryococelus australis TaxID=614101 RepID=A0ABQ9GGS3_9NEOP|nr:hypothetical protein PR048_027537 [Dryococelus australis]